MPYPKRIIEPVNVARNTLPDNFPLPSELEAVTNGTLANTVRQLSSLSKHAEDLFAELTKDAQQLFERSNNLQARIDRLSIKVTQLDSTVEEVSLQDIHTRSTFKSTVAFNQQIFSRSSMPTAMMETYNTCDRPPPLDKLNCYRDDGKDGLKFYTDPNYFFELWRQEMLNDTERMMHDKVRRGANPPGRQQRQSSGSTNTSSGTPANDSRHKKRVRQPHNTRERQKQIAVGHGEYIMPSNAIYQHTNAVLSPYQAQSNSPLNHYQAAAIMLNNSALSPNAETNNNNYCKPNRPNSIEIRSTYEATDGGSSAARPAPNGNLSNNLDIYYQSEALEHQQQLANNSSLLDTPTRRMRPSQPPPAPPSANGTPLGNQQSTQRAFMPNGGPKSPPLTASGMRLMNNNINTPLLMSPPSAGRETLPPPPPPPSNDQQNNQMPDVCGSLDNSNGAATVLPPPPPINTIENSICTSPPPPPPPPMGIKTTDVSSEPPPPPPPMPMLTNGGGAADEQLILPKKLVMTPSTAMYAHHLHQMDDPRNDLLKAIRDGIKLRKVEKNEQKEMNERMGGNNGLHDVASILARRVAVEFSDSDSDDGIAGAGGAGSILMNSSHIRSDGVVPISSGGVASDSECDSEGWGENETEA